MTKDGAIFNVPLELVDEWQKSGWKSLDSVIKTPETAPTKKVTRKPKED